MATTMTLKEAQEDLARRLAQNQARAQARSSGLVSGGVTITPNQTQTQGPSLVEQFQAAQEAANAANEARFQQGLRLFEEQQRLAASMGAQEAQDIRAGAAQTQARGQQDLVSRGLGNTTAVLAPRIAAQREADAGLGRLRDRQTQRRLGIIGDKIGFIERREDTGPDFGLLAQLMQAQGQGSVVPQSTAPIRRRRERQERPTGFAPRTPRTVETVRGTLPRLTAPTAPEAPSAEILAEIAAGLAANRRALGSGRGAGTLRITGGRNPTTTFSSAGGQRFTSARSQFGDRFNQAF